MVKNNLPYAILERLWSLLWLLPDIRYQEVGHEIGYVSIWEGNWPDTRPIWFDEDFFESCIFEGFKSELFSWNKNQVLKLVHFLFYFVSICTKFSNIKLITKYYLTKKKLWHFFSKIELQRQWSCVMCTWQGLFNARGKNFALPPPLTGRNIHSGSKGGVKNQKHKCKFCLIISYFPHFSNWNCLKPIF